MQKTMMSIIRYILKNSVGLIGPKMAKVAGSEGFSYRLEAIKIVIQEKRKQALGSTDKPFEKMSSVSIRLMCRISAGRILLEMAP